MNFFCLLLPWNTLTSGFYILACKYKAESNTVFYFDASRIWVFTKKKIKKAVILWCIHIHTHTYVCIYLYTHIYIHICIDIYRYMHIYTHLIISSNVDLFKPV